MGKFLAISTGSEKPVAIRYGLPELLKVGWVEVGRRVHHGLLDSTRGHETEDCSVSKVSFREIWHIQMFMLPALSFVPEARAPPNGCWPTTAPVHLSL